MSAQRSPSAQGSPSARRRGIVPTVSSAAERVGTMSRKVAELAADRLAAPKVTRSLAPRRDDRFTVVVHFAGDAASAYQLEQWLWPLEQLAQQTSVGILCRGARTAERIARLTDLPVRFGRWMAQVDALLGNDTVRCVLYVNQATQNFQALDYARPAHVHLSHGESEKSSMVSNKLKGYDYVLTAGQAARDRLMTQLIGFGPEKMIDVGRPQLDAPAPVPQEWQDHLAGSPVKRGPVVFWAPTWEGDSPAMAYGTLPESGPRIVRALAEADARIIYRPHPRTGYLQKSFKEADEEIRTAVREAGGFVDSTPRVGWQFQAADGCIAEMSSVAFDWLTTRKPLVLIRPSDPRATVQAGGLFDRVPSFDAAEAGAAAMRTALVDLAAGTAEVAGRYLGDTAPGRQIERFIGAVLAVAEERERRLTSD
ncbi:CDP-glycerol glycerophosphotransferase family protein [Brevibacterium salitolerans]